MTDDVINDNPCVGVIADVDCVSTGERLPLAVNIINKIDKRSRAISWAKQHNRVRPLDCIGPLKSKFFLTGKSDCQLVVSGRSVVQPHPLSCPKFF
jgi:hypothetical protein